MGKAIIDGRDARGPKKILRAIGEAIEQLGWRVDYWRVEAGELPDCDLVVLWSSIHPNYGPALEKIRRKKIKALFVQNGWRPKETTFQVDTFAANGLATWAREPMDVRPGTPLKVKSGYLLVACQDGMYAASKEFSPWFSGSEDFIEHFLRHSRLPCVFRSHPLDPISPKVISRIEAAGAKVDRSRSVEEALSGAAALATIHSTVAVDAMIAGLPVLCYGRAAYRHHGAVYEMDDSPLKTWCRTNQLKAGNCELDANSQAAVLARLQARQWSFGDLPHRLGPLLA